MSPYLDIDHYLNPIVPRNRVYALPKFISHFLGYRPTPQKPVGSLLIWLWSFIGAVAGLLVVEAVFRTHQLARDGAPIIIGSLGASAILIYNTIDSPLSQPRNAILGQVFSSLIGVSIARLFNLSPRFEAIRFVGGALAVGISSVVMGFTKTVHPPAGATALLAVTSNEVMELGWFLVPLILLGSVLMVAVACVVNNLGRKYPVYWWSAEGSPRKKKQKMEGNEDGSESGDVDLEKGGKGNEGEAIEGGGEHLILVNGTDVSVPEWITLSEEETAVLEGLRCKIEKGLGLISSRGSQATFVGEGLGGKGKNPEKENEKEKK